MKDIARDVGVSTVTVSKVMRNCKDVGEKTRQRVLKRMKDLNYEPNLMARALSGGKTSIVGLVVPDLLHPFFAELAKSLGAIFRENSQALLLASSEGDPELEQHEIRALLARGVDVLLIASCQIKLKNFYKLGEEQTPFLLVDRNYPYLNAHFVGSDDFKVGEIATQHLIETGCKRIAHVGSTRLSIGLERMRGYREVLQRNRITVPSEYVIVKDKEQVEVNDVTVGYEAVKQLIQLKHRPDAVFCFSDLVAIGGIRAALDAGLRVPHDISFVGCGNFRYAEYLEVPLTSVDQNTEKLGKTAAEQALQLIERPELPAASILVEPELRIRTSSRR
jgi:LacI family transcriptional regulator